MITRSTPASRSRSSAFSSARGHRRGMRDDAVEARREALDLRRPVGEQRRRRDEQAGAPRLARVAARSQHQQQRQHLDRLAEAHVVGEAGAEAEAWRAGAASARPPADRAAASPSARRRDRAAPAASGSRRPASVFASHGPATTRDQSGAAAATLSPGTCAPASRRIASPKAEPVLRRGRLDRAGTRSSIRLSRSRSTSTQRPRTRCRPFDAASSCSNLRRGQRLAVEADVHLEIEQRVRAEPGRRLAADRGA